MVVEYFKSVVCPRCINVSRELKRLEKENPQIEIKQIEVITNMNYAKSMGIKGIPVLKIGDSLLGGGIIPSKNVREFVLSHLKEN